VAEVIVAEGLLCPLTSPLAAPYWELQAMSVRGTNMRFAEMRIHQIKGHFAHTFVWTP
jgi:hypothetical protein